MISSQDLKGVMGMMPAFSTPDAQDITVTNTVAVDNLRAGVERIIKDGINVIATTGTYGECYNLLFDEFKILARATVETVKKRVPLFIGVTSANPREVVQKMKVVRELGADGVLLGVPYYVRMDQPNAVRFYQEVGKTFPDLGIMIYHNPENHKYTIPVAAFEQLSKVPTIVGMKDSHRTPLAFMNLQRIVKGKISVFVNQLQLYPYYDLGAAGCWSTEVWMGPWPVLHLWDLARQGKNEEAKQVIADLASGGDGGFVPGGIMKRPQEYADYCHAGPSRAPFWHFDEAMLQKARQRAAHWMKLNEKYRPLVEAARKQKQLAAA